METRVRQRFFISYAHASAEDEALCHRFAEALMAAGHEVFVDRRIPPGLIWQEEIERRIRECDVFLLLLSKSALESDFVLQEMERAVARFRQTGAPQICPVLVRLEGALPLAWARLNPFQWSVWRGAADFEPILQSIQGRATSTVPGPVPPPPRPWRRWVSLGSGAALLMALAAISPSGRPCLFVPSFAMQQALVAEPQMERVVPEAACDPAHVYCIELPGVGRFALPSNGVLIGPPSRSLAALMVPDDAPAGTPPFEPARLQRSLRHALQGASDETAPVLLIKARSGEFVRCEYTQDCQLREGVRRCQIQDDGC